MPTSGIEDRAFWVDTLMRVARPVLRAMAAGRLKAEMPVETAAPDGGDRRAFAHLEALGRTLAGVAPWLELAGGDDGEAQARATMVGWARASIDAATHPESPDRLDFRAGEQNLVDAALLAQGVLRAPTELWAHLAPAAQQRLVDALHQTRRHTPYYNNHILFAAIIEALLYRVGADWDPARVDFAVRQCEQWYLGDGMFADGPGFAWDYYNSFVIHPMLVDILQTVAPTSASWEKFREPALQRATRHAEVLERMIAPDGTFPPLGRSLTYRFGAFHLLAQMALLKRLPAGVSPAQVRGALTAVIRRHIEAPGTFDSGGWLTLGFCGHQPGLAEPYVSTGSLYMCLTGLLPLGLSPQDEFWVAPPRAWTAARIWAGENAPCDRGLPLAETPRQPYVR